MVKQTANTKEREMTANDLYYEAREKTDSKLQAIAELLKEHDKNQQQTPQRWTHNGDIDKVNYDLDLIIEFLS
jgi:hypothetical protein